MLNADETLASLGLSRVNTATLGGRMDSTPDLSILPADLQRIREAVTVWKGADLANSFWGARVVDHATAWSELVETDWNDWDQSEYNHDLGCRYWLQVALEHCDPSTRTRLAAAIRATDEDFQARMRPAARPAGHRIAVLSEYPYFWETHTIYPALWVP